MKKHKTYSIYVVVVVIAINALFVSCGTKKKTKQQAQTTQITNNSKETGSTTEFIYKNNFYEALRLKTVGDLEESQKVLEWCLKQKPEDDAVLFLLATYAENSRHISRARDYIKRACDIDPKNIWYVEMLARIQMQTDDYVGAEANYKRLLEYDRYNKEWLYFYSETLMFNLKFSEAIDVLSRLIDELGPVPELVHQRNELYIDQKRENEMLTTMRKLILDYPDMPDFTTMLLNYYQSKKQLGIAENEFNEVLKQNTNHAAARIALANLYNHQGNTNQALDQLKLAFDTNVLSVESAIQVLIAIIDGKKEINPKAETLAQILVEKHPNHFMSHALLGEIKKKFGKKQEALTAFEKSLELNVDNYELWLEVVATQYALKRYTGAMKKAEDAIALFPSQPQLYYFAGMSAMHLKAFTEAINHLETGKDYVVRDPSFKAQFDLAMAEVYLAQNNIPKARKLIESADYLAANDKQIQNNRAYLLAKYKLDLEKALGIIQQVIVDSENDPQFLDTYAWVRYARKEYKEALELIKQAHNISPNNAEINEHYGDILFKLNRVDEAISYWIRAKELGDESQNLLNKIQSKKLLD